MLEAQGSVLTNKYAEGYPGRRYYGGCEFVDVAERLAIERAKRLFGCDFANVQPHSGAQANQAVFLALLKPGDTVLGMSLAAGGHLTHGAPPNLSGKWFNAIHYGVRAEDGRDRLRRGGAPGRDARPKLIIAGGSAYPRIIDFARFREIADGVGAYLMVDMAHFAGLVAGGAHPSPLPHAHVVTTTTHKTLRGPRGGMILEQRRGDREEDQLGRFPRAAGRAADARHRRQGGRLRRGAAARVSRHMPAPSSPTRRRWPKRWSSAGLAIVSGGTDTHLMLVDLRPDGPDRPRCRGKRSNAPGITCNKNGIPFDPAEADRDLGHPARLAGGDDARLRGGGIPPDRPMDRRGVARAGAEPRRQCRHRNAGARRGRRAVRPLSDLLPAPVP